MSIVPDYVEARIRQRSPQGAPVVPGSTPVVAFGDVRKAWIATLGLNPSRIEFLNTKGKEVVGDERRLETLSSLGVGDLATAPDAIVERVFEGCNSYFRRRPYRWFNKLERVLRSVNASYSDDSACHLDLVQWATDPTWGGLSQSAKSSLLESDLPFLDRQLAQEHVRLLLLNGTAIVKACTDLLHVQLSDLSPAVGGRVKVVTGCTRNGVRVVGWNINLQSSFGVSNNEIDAIGASVSRLIS